MLAEQGPVWLLVASCASGRLCARAGSGVRRRDPDLDAVGRPPERAVDGRHEAVGDGPARASPVEGQQGLTRRLTPQGRRGGWCRARAWWLFGRLDTLVPVTSPTAKPQASGPRWKRSMKSPTTSLPPSAGRHAATSSPAPSATRAGAGSPATSAREGGPSEPPRGRRAAALAPVQAMCSATSPVAAAPRASAGR